MRRYTSLPLMLSVCGATAAFGQSADDGEFNLGTIVIDTVSDTNELAYDQDDLTRVDPTDLQDLFRTEPTVSVGSSIPASQKLYVNGIEETNLAYSIDGGRQNNKIFHHNATTLVDPELLKAVRVEPGVAPAGAGPGALAGAIAFETKDVADLLEDGDGFGGYASPEVSSNGDTTSLSGAVYGRSGGFEYLAFGKTADGDIRTDGDGDDIVGSGTDLQSGLGKVAYEATGGDRIELSFERVNDDAARPYRANIGQITGGRPVPLTRNYDIERTNLILTYSDSSPTDLYDPTVRLAFSDTDLTVTEPDQTIFGSTDSLNGEVSNTFTLPNGTVTAGIDFYDDTATLDYDYLPDRSFDETGEESLRNIGLFAQARLDLSDALRLSYGARADFQDFTGTDGNAFDDEGLSGNVSVDYDVTPDTTLSAGYSRVWGGVLLAENFIINPAWTYPEDGIDPATGRNIYLAARTDIGSLGLSGKVFRSEIEDARLPDYRLGSAVTRNVESEGFEIGVDYGWSNGSARLAYASIDTEVDGRQADSDLGRYLTAPLGERLTVEVIHTFADIGLTIGGDAEFVFEEDSYDPYSDAPGQTLDSYTVVNVFTEYTPRQFSNVVFRGEINNLLDETYASRATYGQEYPGVVPLREPGRTFEIGATFRF